MRQIVLAGHEIEAAPARRHRRLERPVVFPMSLAERQFMLFRLADRTAMADWILHRHPVSIQAMLPGWSRDQVLEHLDNMISVLRSGRNLILVSRLDKLLAIEAIEGNPYFARMDESDKRLTVAGVRAANALRERLAAALDKRIGRINIGAGRKRLVESDV